MSKKKKKRAPMGPVRKIIVLLSLVIFFGAGYYLADYVADNHQAQKGMEEVLKEKTKIGLVKLHKENEDLIGWLKIDGTNIDYPVMQTPKDDEYYLHRDFNREYSEAGTLFMDGECVVADMPKDRDSDSDDTDDTYDSYYDPYASTEEEEDNEAAAAYGEDGTWSWLIYGHHMKYGTMFHDLVNYESEEFYRDHKYFLFNVLRKDPETGKLYEETGKYRVVAAAYYRIYPKDSKYFKYYDYPECTDEKSFKEYVKGVREESLYKAGKKPKYGMQLVVLSTCAYQTEDGRFYIVGKRIDD